MDSFTALNKAVKEGFDVYALSFDYGQKHNKELYYAQNVCNELNVPHKILDIRSISTLILISLAIGYAVDIEAEGVWYGAHSGDHLIYPDCRPEFVKVMDQASKVANFEPVYVHAPYLNTDKIGILKDGIKMDLDYSKTWTCYKGQEKACGTCGSCVERLEAFELNNCTDPIKYLN